jgi:hypothetical protein
MRKIGEIEKHIYDMEKIEVERIIKEFDSK